MRRGRSPPQAEKAQFSMRLRGCRYVEQDDAFMFYDGSALTFNAKFAGVPQFAGSNTAGAGSAALGGRKQASGRGVNFLGHEPQFACVQEQQPLDPNFLPAGQAADAGDALEFRLARGLHGDGLIGEKR